MKMLDNAAMETNLIKLKSCLEEVEADAEVVPASDVFPLPSLVVWADGERTENGRVVVINYVPLDDGTEYTDFIQFYVELPIDLGERDELEVLRIVDNINRSMPVGHCMLVEQRPDMPYRRMVGARYMLGAAREDGVDASLFLESISLFIMACDAATVELGGVVPGE